MMCIVFIGRLQKPGSTVFETQYIGLESLFTPVCIC